MFKNHYTTLRLITFLRLSLLLVLALIPLLSYTQALSVVIDPSKKHQVIDGFGAHQSGVTVNQNWWLNLFFEDMSCSIYRVDLSPQLKSPFSDLSYFSPWFMGSATKSVFNLEDPANPNGPENNRVRTYTGPNDYSRTFGGRQAPIAVMGPDIEKNILQFSYSQNDAIKMGVQKKEELGDFKLIGSLWSPVPWVKVSSGNRYPDNSWPGPVINTPWPFIWGGNFAGGRLDVSNTPLAVFNDSNQGGNGNTSSLTQFARSTAAYILGYQRFHGAQFYAISIQNELNFEQFYHSATYPLSSQYIAAVKVLRAEFDKYPELRTIKIMGPEDLLGGDSYGMWEYGGPTHKNLQYLKNIEADSFASKAVDFYCIHGYANDGVSSAGSNPRQWDWWVNGWTASPAQGLPANVKGFSSYNKKSWMTETSGENREWLFPKTNFPGDGGLGVAIRIHQALTTGLQSAWIYWTFTTADNMGQVTNFGLTSQLESTNSPKYVGAKHFYKFIRPNAVRVSATVSGKNTILASAYQHILDKTLTLVLINSGNTAENVNITLPMVESNVNGFTSSENSYWQSISAQLVNGKANVALKPYSVTTLQGQVQTTFVSKFDNRFEKEPIVYPMPFAKKCTLAFSLQRAEKIQITLVDANGKQMVILPMSSLDKGYHAMQIQATHMANGMYRLCIESPDNKIYSRNVFLEN